MKIKRITKKEFGIILIFLLLITGVISNRTTPNKQNHNIEEILNKTPTSISNLTFGFFIDGATAYTENQYDLEGTEINVKTITVYSNGQFRTNITVKDLRDTTTHEAIEEGYSANLMVHPILRPSLTYRLNTTLTIHPKNTIVHTKIEKYLGTTWVTYKQELEIGAF